jgi:hypothetical protein
MRLYRKHVHVRHVVVVMPPTGGEMPPNRHGLEGNYRTSRHRRDVDILPHFNSKSSLLLLNNDEHRDGNESLRHQDILTCSFSHRTAILGHHGTLHQDNNTAFTI